MIRSVFLVALALGCVSAQNRWPMITVNAAGEIVLQSLTRAQAFQITPTAVTTGPTSSTTASLTTVTALAAGVSAYDVTAATSFATNHGVALPTVTLGASVTLYQKASTIVSYVIWSQTSNFINADSSQQSFIVEAIARRVTCTGVSATRWNCVTDFTGGNSALSTGRAVTTSTSTTTYTLTAANILGGLHVATPTAAYTITLDTASNIIAAASTASSLTDAYEFTVTNAATTESAATSLLITLAVGTGITSSNAADLLIAPGMRVTYILYRTASSTFTLLVKSKNRVINSAVTCPAITTHATAANGYFLLATTAATTVSAGAGNSAITCNAGQGSLSVGISATAPGTSVVTFTNGHAILGQSVTAYLTSETLGTAGNAVNTPTCIIPSSGTLTCQTVAPIVATTGVTYVFTFIIGA